MIFSTAMAELYSFINDPDHRFITENEAQDWLNLANMEECAARKILWNYTTLSTDGTAVIDLSINLSDFLAPLHVFYNESEISYLSVEDLIKKDWRWPSRTGTPDHYYLRGKYLGLFPYLTSAGTNDIALHYLQKPTVLSADNDPLMEGIPRFEPLHSLVTMRAALKAAAKLKDKERIVFIRSMYDSLAGELAWIIENPVQGKESYLSEEGAMY